MKKFPAIFLSRYEKLGVSNFVFYDDNSTDKTWDILERESRWTVLQSKYTFSQQLKVGNAVIAFNDHLKKNIHTAFFRSSWGIYLDCDEFMILPKSVNFLQ
jgi:hypothetical protein